MFTNKITHLFAGSKHLMRKQRLHRDDDNASARILESVTGFGCTCLHGGGYVVCPSTTKVTAVSLLLQQRYTNSIREWPDPLLELSLACKQHSSLKHTRLVKLK
jgi:hypothetical protein